MKKRISYLSGSGIVVFILLIVWVFSMKVDAAEANYLWPVPASRQINQYYTGAHDGLDIGAGSNVPIVASKSGTVVAVIHGDVAGKWIGYGNGVVISHGDGYYTHYAHLSSTCVNTGQAVSQGQQIGNMGASGNATGRHLHFAIATSQWGGGGRINCNPGTINYIYSIGNNPQGCVDSITGGLGKIVVKGWAFDMDNAGTQIPIHVYIGGPAGSGAEGHAITANVYRPDVDNVYHTGAYHGFSSSITTSKTGNQPVYIYAINVGGGENICIGSGTVNITRDSEKPEIYNIKISEVNNKGYKVSCNISDNVGVTKFQFPTWKTSRTSAGCKWYEGSKNGSTYSFVFSDADLEGDYITHIYAWDAAGNTSCEATPVVFVDKTNPIVSDVKVTDVSENGYTVTCKSTDNKLVNRVQFPTWTTNEGQDDLQAEWWTSTKVRGTKSGDLYSFKVNISEHNFEPGIYRTHIYAYDDCGNYVCVHVPDVTVPAGSKIIKEDDYHIVTAVDTKKGLDVKNGSSTNGTNIQINENLADENQIFTLKYITDGYYTIVHKATGKVLDVYGASTKAGTNVILHEYNGGVNQQWYIHDSGDHKNYYIISRCGNKALDVYGGYSANGTNVQIWDQNQTSGQKWSFVTASGKSNGDNNNQNDTEKKVNLPNVNITSYVPYADYIQFYWETISNVSGIEIQIATNSSMTGAKTACWKLEKSAGGRLVGLAENTTYYLRLRSYKESDKSEWSDILKITTKSNNPQQEEDEQKDENTTDKKTPKVTLNKTSLKGILGQSDLLTVSTDSEGQVTYQSDDVEIANVYNTGAIYYLAAGKTYITVSIAETKDFRSVKMRVPVTVTKKQQIIYGSGKYTVKRGKKIKLDAYSNESLKLKYKTANKKIATVSSSGVVTGKKKGKTTITVSADENKNYDKATKIVTIIVK